MFERTINSLQLQTALKSRKMFGYSTLVSFSLLVFAIRSMAIAHQPSTSAISQSSILSNSTTVVTQNRSLPSSIVLLSQAMSGGGALQVSNGTNRDAYVKLVEPNSRTLMAAFYVKSNSSHTQEQIPDGTYQVLFVLGKNWNPTTQAFATSKSFAKFDKFLNYTTTQLSDRIQYRVFKITLHPVTGGKARTSGVNEREFNRY